MCRVQREKTWYSAQRGVYPVTVPGPKWKSWLRGDQDRLMSSSCDSKSADSGRECLKRRVQEFTGSPSFGDLLLGIGVNPAAPVHISEDDVIKCALPTTLVDRWEPSPDSPKKRQLRAKIAIEVRKQAGDWGELRNAYVNNFNVDDPNVYAIADVVNDDGEEERAFISMHLSSRGEGSCTTWRVHDEETAPQRLLTKVVLVGPLNLGFRHGFGTGDIAAGSEAHCLRWSNGVIDQWQGNPKRQSIRAGSYLRVLRQSASGAAALRDVLRAGGCDC